MSSASWERCKGSADPGIRALLALCAARTTQPKAECSCSQPFQPGLQASPTQPDCTADVSSMVGPSAELATLGAALCAAHALEDPEEERAAVEEALKQYKPHQHHAVKGAGKAATAQRKSDDPYAGKGS